MRKVAGADRTTNKNLTHSRCNVCCQCSAVTSCPRVYDSIQREAEAESIRCLQSGSEVTQEQRQS